MKRRGIFVLCLLASIIMFGCASTSVESSTVSKYKEFQSAINMGKMHRIARLIKKSTPEENRDGLSQAIRAESVKAVRIFLAGGVDINSVRHHRTPLWEACWLNKTGKIVELLLEKGADVNTVDSLGNSALREAVVKGHSETVSLLIQYGADVNVQYDGRTLLYTAQVSYKNAGIAKMLRDAGAKLSEEEELAIQKAIEAEKLKKQKEAEIAKLKENLNNFYNEVIHRKGTPIKTGDEFLIGCGCIEVLDRTTTQAGYTYLVTYYPNTDERLAWRDGDVNCFYIVSKKEMTLHQSYFFYDQPFSLNDKEYYTTSLKDLKLTCIGKGKYQRKYQDWLYDVKVGRGIGEGKYQQNYQDVSCYMFSLDAEL